MSSPISDPAPAEVTLRPRSPFTVASPFFALAVLFSMNLLNYIDRYVFFSAGTKIQRELGFSDPQFATLSVAFMVVYTIVSPLVGWLGDRYNRKVLLAFGVGLWSVATVGTSFARGFNDMFFWRALLGVGEASYGIIALTLLADLFSTKNRGRVIGLYFLALPLGGAIGYLIGGHYAEHGDWRHAFLVVGLPGLAAAVAGLLMHDPGRGPRAHRPGLSEYLSILKTKSFLFNTAGQASVTFAIGAYAVWGAIFYHRVRGMAPAAAGLKIGILSASAGIFGVLLGTLAAEVLRKFTSRAYLVWPFLAVATAVPCGTLALLETDVNRSLAFLFVASMLMASVLGPSNAVTVNVVPANRRAAGVAICVFLVHLFGDISSPVLIGVVSDYCGRPEVIDSPAGRLFASVGARPDVADGITTNLTVGMLAVVPMLVLGCVFFLLGSKHLPRDQERARALSGGDDPGAVFAH